MGYNCLRRAHYVRLSEAKLNVPLELTAAEHEMLAANSVERVINTAIEIVEESSNELSGMNLDDWEELKPLICKIWRIAQNEQFKIGNRKE